MTTNKLLKFYELDRKASPNSTIAQKLGACVLSPEVMEWLGGWLSGGKSPKIHPPEKARDELSQFKCEGDVVLYRGVVGDELKDISGQWWIFLKTPCSSWTYDPEMARNFSSTVVTAQVKPEEILVDTTLLDPRYIIDNFSGFPDEKEVIVCATHLPINVVSS